MEALTAFVTGASHPTALGAARALRAAGATVVGFTRSPGSWSCRSRAWRRIEALPGPTLADDFNVVLEKAEDWPGPVFLLPTEDGMVAEISKRRHELSGNVRTTLPPPGAVELLLEKTRFAEWAREGGYPLPESVVVRSREEFDALSRAFPFPAILKPLVRTPEWQQASPVQKAIRLERAGDLDKVTFDPFSVAPSYVLSEWIPGGDSDVLFCLAYLDAEGRMVAHFTGRKLLQYPRLTGSTAICVDHPEPELERLTARLLASAGCRGLASLEVKRRAGDGRLLITEPTVGRPNLQSYAAVAAGVNLHGIAMRDCWEQEHDDLHGPPRPVVWVEEGALFELLTTPTGLGVPWRLIASSLVRARRVSGAYGRWGDSTPLRAMMANRIRRGARRLTLRKSKPRNVATR